MVSVAKKNRLHKFKHFMPSFLGIDRQIFVFSVVKLVGFLIYHTLLSREHVNSHFVSDRIAGKIRLRRQTY